jgi:hypothetical protein
VRAKIRFLFSPPSFFPPNAQDVEHGGGTGANGRGDGGAIANGWGGGKDAKGMATGSSPPSKISWVSSVITDCDGNMQVGTASQRILSACRSRSVDLELQLKGSLVSPFLLGFQPIIFLERTAKALPRSLLDEERNKASASPVFLMGTRPEKPYN